MIKKKNIRFIFCIAAALACMTALNNRSYSLNAEYGNNPFARAVDTSAFLSNSKQGWSVLSSYLHRDRADRVAFELILKCSESVNDWSTEQFVGSITDQAYTPVTELKLNYFLLKENRWVVRITPEGKVYLSVTEGVAPIEKPLILPIKVQYNRR